MMIVKKIFFSLIMLCFYSFSIAQQHDNLWLFGYDSNDEFLDFGGTNIDFSTSPPDIYRTLRPMNFNITATSICDPEGNLLFYTNGIYIANKNNEPMENGGGLNPGEFIENQALRGDITEQSALILPMPDNPDIYYLLHNTKVYPSDTLEWHTNVMYYSKIDITQNNGLGAVIEKNQIIIQDTLETGELTATKHANGRDWWFLINEYNNNSYYRFLLTPDGIDHKGKQALGENITQGVGQAVYSPNGSKYARYVSYRLGHEASLNIYDFDRCTGELSNPLQIPFVEEANFGGVAISPNSRYLYLGLKLVLYQYDLWAEDIAASRDTVAVWDGFTAPFATTFFLGQLAPNGKIYFNTTSSNTVLHVIHEPDEAGEACNVEQHGIQLPTYNNGSMPNFPNYRLGALADSPCDTLISSTTALPTNTQHIQLYPNPAQYQVQLALATPFSKTVDVEIIDVLGNVVGRDILAAQVKELRLSLEGLVAGIYFISIKTPDGHILSRKLIISE